MGSFGGYYKGDKKKPKKEGKNKSISFGVVNPTAFSMPEIFSKKKKES